MKQKVIFNENDPHGFLNPNGIITFNKILVYNMYNAISPKDICLDIHEDKHELTFTIDNCKRNSDDIRLSVPVICWETIFLNGNADVLKITEEEFYNLCGQLLSKSNDVFKLAIKILFRLGYEYSYVKYGILMAIHAFLNQTPTNKSFINLNSENNKSSLVKYLYSDKNKQLININDLIPPWNFITTSDKKDMLVLDLFHIHNQKKYFKYEFLNIEMFNKMVENYKIFLFLYYNTNHGIDVDFLVKK